MPTKKPSARYSLSREDFEKILTAFVFSGLAAIISGLIAVVSSPEIELPAWVVPLVPAINTFLYGALKYSTGPKA
jgi:hypothetical protein